MATMNELIERGNKLAGKYPAVTLKHKLVHSIACDDNEERLAIQWALKKITGEKNGYKFTLEQLAEIDKRLEV